MLEVTDLYGNSEPLTNHSILENNFEINTVPDLNFTVYRKFNERAFDMITEKCVITEVESKEMYRIEMFSCIGSGDTIGYNVQCLHIVKDLNNKLLTSELKGSQTIKSCMDFIVSGTKFTYEILDSFSSFDFESLGNDFALNVLLNNILVNFKAEFEVTNYHIVIRKKIGIENAFIFADGFNINKLSFTNDSTNLATRISGDGKSGDNGNPIVTTTYTSPNADIYGIIDAAKYSDDSTTTANLKVRLKETLQDVPDISITLDYVQFTKGNIHKKKVERVGLGNAGYVRGKNIDVYSRIQKITLYPQSTKTPVVSINSVKGTLSKTLAHLKEVKKGVKK
ncbi:hypothetical protein E1Q00_15090 [Listeria monocytogenes]|nr:hypothetical protein [Listeria monocytogenes]EAG9067847.1 hypothetical protein [Listeria monocytogenes]